MKSLFISGIGEAPGKTAVAVGLGAHWGAAGQRIGYLRPRFGATGDSLTPEADVAFLRSALGLGEAAAGPVFTSPSPLEEDGSTLTGEIRRATEPFDEVDLLLVEGQGQLDGAAAEAEARSIIAALDAKVLLLVRYHQRMGADAIVVAGRALGAALAGVVLNGAPAGVIPAVREDVSSTLGAAGIPLLGIIPESRPLFGFSVGDIADHLRAEYLCLPEKRDGLVENLLIGANASDPALSYFAPKPNSAVFCRIDRPDIQLAALDTPIRCLVFTGGGYLQTSVIYRTEDLGVPVMQVPTDTIATVRDLAGLIEGLRFHQHGKIPVIQSLLKQHLDFEALAQALDIG